MHMHNILITYTSPLPAIEWCRIVGHLAVLENPISNPPVEWTSDSTLVHMTSIPDLDDMIDTFPAIRSMVLITDTPTHLITDGKVTQ